MRQAISWLALLGLVALAAGQAAAKGGDWSSFITAEQLKGRLESPNLVVIDARSPAEYEAGHIPGAINVPGIKWRTPAAEAGQIGQQIFRTADGKVDIARYERHIGDAGIAPESEVVVYGNYAGKTDGSVPAAILLKLGHNKVAFLDGVGLDEWRSAGFHISRTPRTLPPTKYAAKLDATRFWSAKDVLANLKNPDVVILDSRTPAEFSGEDLRGNERGGHIPGAKPLNSEEFLDPATHTMISLAEARAKIEPMADKEKTVVIYCQSGTRCSLKALMLEDLGYKRVMLYDASFQEWSGLEGAPVDEGEK